MKFPHIVAISAFAVLACAMVCHARAPTDPPQVVRDGKDPLDRIITALHDSPQKYRETDIGGLRAALGRVDSACAEDAYEIVDISMGAYTSSTKWDAAAMAVVYILLADRSLPAECRNGSYLEIRGTSESLFACFRLPEVSTLLEESIAQAVASNVAAGRGRSPSGCSIKALAMFMRDEEVQAIYRKRMGTASGGGSGDSPR